MFYIFGSLGVLWFAFWVQNASSGPLEDSAVSETESAYILENTCDQVCWHVQCLAKSSAGASCVHCHITWRTM